MVYFTTQEHWLRTSFSFSSNTVLVFFALTTISKWLQTLFSMYTLKRPSCCFLLYSQRSNESLTIGCRFCTLMSSKISWTVSFLCCSLSINSPSSMSSSISLSVVPVVSIPDSLLAANLPFLLLAVNLERNSSLDYCSTSFLLKILFDHFHHKLFAYQ